MINCYIKWHLEVLEIEAPDDVIRVVRVVSVLADQVKLVVVIHPVTVTTPVLVTLQIIGQLILIVAIPIPVSVRPFLL